MFVMPQCKVFHAPGNKWVSSFNTDFNFDFNVSFTLEQRKSGKAIYNYAPLDMDIDEREGVSAFYKDRKGDIYHTYSSYARGHG